MTSAMPTVAILSPGDMGHAVGRVLRESGLESITCLTGRSERTHALAAQAGIRDVPTLEALVTQADLILSILVPSEAVALAERVAEALRMTGAHPAYADCNAIAPATAQRIDTIITEAGGRSIDASIIGGPPTSRTTPRFYAAGPHAALLAVLDGRGISVNVLDGPIGHASGLKMCYAALTKGTSALHATLLISAEALGLSQALRDEFAASQPQALAAMENLRQVPAKAVRWVGEMEEIAATFAAVGVTPRMHLGAADLFRLIAASPLGHERPETVDPDRTLEQTVTMLAACLDPSADMPEA